MKVGDYVRTNNGSIGKISFVKSHLLNTNDICFNFEHIPIDYVYNKNDIKASPNIIDLIEVGDYVNGEPVKSVLKDCEGETLLTASERGYLVAKEDIKSIVTKEMFADAEYRVETN